MKLYLTNLNNKIKFYESNTDFKFEIECMIKATISYIEFNKTKIKNIILEKDLITNELNDLLLILKTYCYLYHFDNSFTTSDIKNSDLINEPKLEIKVLSENNNNDTSLKEIIIENNNTNLVDNYQLNSSLYLNNNDLVEFWATFTSYWNLFVKYKLDGIYIFILTFRTFDKNEIIITSSQSLIIYNTLIQIYSFNKEHLYELLLFFEYSVKSKLNIMSIEIEQTKLIK
jgi:hypothetical protein